MINPADRIHLYATGPDIVGLDCLDSIKEGGFLLI